MKKLAVASLIFLAGATQMMAQVVSTAKVDLSQRYFEKAYNGLIKYVEGKGSGDFKGWSALGDTYGEFAKLKYDREHYQFGDIGATYSDEELTALQNKFDEPIAEAYKCYEKALKLDAKGKVYKREGYNLKIQGLLRLSINQAINEQNQAAELVRGKETNEDVEKEFERKMQRAHDFYQLTLDLLQILEEKDREEFYTNTFEKNQITYDYIEMSKAKCAYFAKDYAAAEKELSALMKPGFYDLDVFRNLAHIYEKEQKDLEKTKKHWESLRKAFPDSAKIAIEEAVFYQNIGETQTLMKKLDEVIALDPENATLYNVQGKILADMVVDSNNELAKDDDEQDKSKLLDEKTRLTYYNKAMTRLQRAAELNPSEPSSYNLMGVLYYSEGLNLYNQRIKLGTSKADIAKMQELKKGYTEYFNKAIEQYELTLKQDSENLVALDQLQDVYRRMNNVTKSLEYKKLYEAAKKKNQK